MKGGGYERKFSVGSRDTEGSYQECPHQVDRKGVEQRILIKRRAVILSPVAAVLFSGLVTSPSLQKFGISDSGDG